jgi:hypothetical protein
MWRQWLITLDAKPRGFHLVTRELLNPLAALSECRIGLLHLFIKVPFSTRPRHWR